MEVQMEVMKALLHWIIRLHCLHQLELLYFLTQCQIFGRRRYFLVEQQCTFLLLTEKSKVCFSLLNIRSKGYICCLLLRSLQWMYQLTLKPDGVLLSLVTLFLWICLMHQKLITCFHSREYWELHPKSTVVDSALICFMGFVAQHLVI